MHRKSPTLFHFMTFFYLFNLFTEWPKQDRTIHSFPFHQGHHPKLIYREGMAREEQLVSAMPTSKLCPHPTVLPDSIDFRDTDRGAECVDSSVTDGRTDARGAEITEQRICDPLLPTTSPALFYFLCLSLLQYSSCFRDSLKL